MPPIGVRENLPMDPLIFFIIFLMASNWLSSRLTSCTVVPEPFAMRFLRLPSIIAGLRLSLAVIE